MLKSQRLVELLIALVLFTGVLSLSFAEREQTELASKLIRLHVVANSDSAADQTYKLEVRDQLLAELAPVLNGSESREDAENRLSSALPELRRKLFPGIALTLTAERFPERQYDTFNLPAGEYTALRAVIGSGEGKNWWCVLFPPLCVEAVTEFDSEDAFALLSDDEVELITGSDKGYVVKFKVLEIIERLREAFR
ncbi:MAG: stage II sporulation protein R [Oscillospiraceae bacterium]|jgi:stage II sporulation protein R|nr:stage II sporulation protein R [Oscillospiraceae bacterium]